MRVLSINPNQPDPERLKAPVAALEAGALVALPTETFYGLAVDTAHVGALMRLNLSKAKPPNSPVLLLLSGREQVESVSDAIPPQFDDLARRFWPGPLTLVIPARAELDAVITGGRGTVAVRAPGLALPRQIAALLGRPITGVSANLHGEPPCRTALEVVEAFGEGVDWVIDGGATAGGAPSTILDLCGDRPVILREGIVPVSALRPFVSDVRLPL